MSAERMPGYHLTQIGSVSHLLCETKCEKNAKQIRFEPLSPFRERTAQSIDAIRFYVTGTAGLESKPRS